MDVYKMITHHTDKPGAIAWTRENRRIAIGWGKIGDVARYEDENAIKDAIKARYPIPPYKNNAHLGAPSLWDFCHTLTTGDLIILSGRIARELVVEISGDYEFVAGASPLFGEYNHQRPIEITRYDPEELWLVAGGAPGKSRYQTLVQCENAVDLSEL